MMPNWVYYRKGSTHGRRFNQHTHVPLILFGDVKKEDRNFNILYDYIRNVSFGNKAEKLTYPTEFSEIKNQEYFALFSQVLCV